MQNLAKIEPVDYLIIGHITQDVTPDGNKLGGTASYASLTALAFGQRVGIVTACSPDLQLDQLSGISIARKNSLHTSTFRNTYTPQGRIQYILHVADTLELEDVPPAWRNTPIVHLGPLTGEISPALARSFPNSLTGITPQGWMRGWNGEGVVSYKPWDEADQVLPYIQAAVMSIEDVRGSEDVVASFASQLSILVVTEGAAGSRVYWNGDVRYFRPPQEVEVDPVGAGDIFAAAFFIKLFQTRDPWEAVKLATLVAANSVTRVGIQGVPTPSEVSQFTTQIVEHPIK
jgi:sugar/nucleoside kinase (ribokinase family)